MPLKIHKRPGSPYWQLTGTVRGKRIRQSSGVSDYALAEDIANQLESKILKRSIYGPEADATFPDACIGYFADHPIQGRKPPQINRLLVSIIKAWNKMLLRDITSQKARSLAIRLLPNCKPQSRNAAVITPISAVMGWAHQAELCGPIRIKRFDVVDERIAETIDREWLAAFMRHASDRVAGFALFCFTTGARPQEACNLRPDQLRLGEGKAIGGVTKNGKRRIYVLVPEMVARLRVLPPKQVTQGPHKGEWRVFGYGSQRGLLAPWRKACLDAGIEYRTRYESGRHSFFTEVIVRNGADVVTAGKLGNCTPAILLRRYAHADAPHKMAMKIFGAKQTQAKRRNLKTVGES